MGSAHYVSAAEAIFSLESSKHSVTQQYAFERDWLRPEFPLNDFPALSRAWDFSRVRLNKIRRLLAVAHLPEEILCIGVAGSLARMEATAASDCDLVVVLLPGVQDDSPAALQAFDQIWVALETLQLERPESDGIYAGPVAYEKLLSRETVGHVSEDPRAFGFRITFLLELQPVYGDSAFRQVSTEIVNRYAQDYVELDESKQWTYLLNDLVRYFKSLCQTYLFAEIADDRRWRLRNLKARHSRLLMYTGLLFLLGESSCVNQEKRAWLINRLSWTPLERLAACYANYSDPKFSIIAGGLDRFVDAMSQPGFRASLAETQSVPGQLRRESNPDFQRLKQNSDLFLRELLRFALARQDDWSERFFEYWLF
jgi:hypothetical protein